MSLPIHIIYHANCDDGFGAAYAAWLQFGTQAQYSAATHGNPPPPVTGQSVYILDFSYPREILLEMARHAHRITILDHHQSARQDLEPLLADGTIEGLFDQRFSGAMLSWQHFHQGSAPKLIQHIQDRDLWQFALPETQAISMALQMYPKTFQDWMPLMQDISPLIVAGEPILRFFHRQIEQLAKSAFYQTIAGFRVPTVNAPGLFASDLGNLLTQGEPFAAIFQETAEHLTFSLRSTDQGEDVARIAGLFGGGGHRNAAGFRLLKQQRELLANMPV